MGGRRTRGKAIYYARIDDVADDVSDDEASSASIL